MAITTNQRLAASNSAVTTAAGEPASAEAVRNILLAYIAENGGVDLTAPGPIGGTTPGTGAFTTVAASGTITSTNGTYSTIIGSNGAVGGYLQMLISGSLIGFSAANSDSIQPVVNGASSNNSIDFGKTATRWRTIYSTNLNASGTLAVTGASTMAAITSTQLALGTTPADGVLITNTTNAATGAQQYSPSLSLSGDGFSTGGGRMAVKFSQYVVPVQGSSSPTGNLTWDSSVGGAAAVTQMTLSTAGDLKATGTIGATMYYGVAGSNGILRMDGNTSARGLGIGSLCQIAWASGSFSGGSVSGDTSLSRNAAGIVQIGTTTTNALGSLLLTNLTASGTLAVTGASTLTDTTMTGTNYPVLDVVRSTAATNDFRAAIRLKRTNSSGTSLAGMGVATFFELPNASNAQKYAGMFGGALSTVTASSEVGELVFSPAWAGVDPSSRRDMVLRATSSTLADLSVSGGISAGGTLTVGGGTAIQKVLSATATLDFDLTAVTVHDLTITVTGAALGDVVSVGAPHGSVTATASYTAWVSAADTVTVRCKTAAAGENPASGTFRVMVTKF